MIFLKALYNATVCESFRGNIDLAHGAQTVNNRVDVKCKQRGIEGKIQHEQNQNTTQFLLLN